MTIPHVTEALTLADAAKRLQVSPENHRAVHRRGEAARGPTFAANDPHPRGRNPRATAR